MGESRASKYLGRFLERMPGNIKRLLTLSIGHPHFTRAYIEQNVRPLASEPEELAQFESCSANTSMTFLRSLLICSSVIHIVRAYTWPVLTLSEINFNQPSENLVPLTTSSSAQVALYQFNCLVSNCSQPEQLLEGNNWTRHMSAPQKLLGEIFIDLPYFALCHPLLSAMHDLTQHLGELGLMLALVSGFVVFVSGALCPLIQILFPTSNLIIMFLVAPNVCTRIEYTRARRLVTEIEDSLQTYSNIVPAFERCHQRSDTKWRLSSALESRPNYSAHPGSQANKPSARQYLNSPSLVLSEPRASHFFRTPPSSARCRCTTNVVQSYEQSYTYESSFEYRHTDAFVMDCVSIARTDWWRALICKNISTLMLVICSAFLMAFVILPPNLIININNHERRINSIGVFMRRSSCAIWIRQAEPADASQPVSDITLHYSILLNSFYAFQAIWPLAVICAYIILYMITTAELTCCLYEIKFHLRIAVEFLRETISLVEATDYYSPTCSSMFCLNGDQLEMTRTIRLDDERHLMLPIEQLRIKFRQVISNSFIMINSKLLAIENGHSLKKGGTRSRLQSALDTRQFVQSLVRQRHLNMDTSVELMEKLYVSLRLYLKKMHENSSTMSVMLTLCTIYVYGIVAIAVVLLRRINKFVFLPILLLVSCWMLANAFIMYAANLHAKGRELNEIIWSLLAVTCQCRELRMRHIHSLWLRQVQALDMDGGLALRAFQVRLTYTRIIQLIVGSGTMLVFALR